MTVPLEPQLEEARPCPQCGALAEPDQDGNVRFFSCPECCAEFGYRRAVQGGGMCAAGIVPLRDMIAVPVPVSVSRRPE